MASAGINDFYIDEFIKYMSYVDKYERQLTKLNDAWEHIKILGEVTCPSQSKTFIPSMNSTQNGFQELQSKLMENLVMESIKKVTLEIRSKAQVAVDIVIRNLFERTADVGFLATDDDIRHFLMAPTPTPQQIKFITQRLVEYVKKYTVYDEIIILDKDCAVKAHLNTHNPIDNLVITNDLIRTTLTSKNPYTETFGPNELMPQNKCSLIYSSRITSANDPDSEVIGVLCLCFRFDNEMEGIFNKLKEEDDPSVILLLDKQGVVIASSEPYHIGLGTKIRTVLKEDYKIALFNGIEYISKTTMTQGYQGFMGLGWFGHVMVPLNLAFRKTVSDMLEKVDPHILAGVKEQATSFSCILGEIVNKAESINLSLRRVVWNGQVMSNDEAEHKNSSAEYLKLKPLLAQISKIGISTSDVFADSIRNLYETIITSSLNDVRFLSSLAIDIMDRNLYERSDDCRWWALTSDFRRMLAQKSIGVEDKEKITQILKYINGLYTVYTNLFVYDKNGVILAISNDAHGDLIDQKLDKDYIRQTLSIHDSQKYIVSPFEPTALYDHKHTYIYSAAITDINNPKNVLGGIGIVFDSEPQFYQMLKDSLPPKDGSFCVYTDKHRTIIASTSPDLKAGDPLEIPETFFQLGNGESVSNIIIYRDSYYAVGCTLSSGYREYKNSADYVNDIIGFAFLKLGSRVQNSQNLNHTPSIKREKLNKNIQGESTEIAIFFVGGNRYAFMAAEVQEAISCESMVTMPGAKQYIEGSIFFHGNPVTVINLRLAFGFERQTNLQSAQIIIVNTKEGQVGFLVDDLGDVPELPVSSLKCVNNNLQQSGGYVRYVVDLENDESTCLLVVVDPERIIAQATTMLKETDLSLKNGSPDFSADLGVELATDHSEKCLATLAAWID